MKKYILYLFLTILLVGISVTTNNKVLAQETGKCYSRQTNQENGFDKTSCDLSNTYNFWLQTGTCYRGGQSLQNYTEGSCVGGKWDPSGSPTGSCVVGDTTYEGYTRVACSVRSDGSKWSEYTKDVNGNPVVPNGGQTTKNTKYTFLAPLPCPKGSPGCVGGKLTTFDPAVPKPFGAYLNIMLRICIGISAVLAVIMIVIAGIQYMTSELSHSKEAAKSRIQDAILGLLIAFGAYSILYTINPDLLRTDLELENITVKAEISEIIPSDSGKAIPPTTQTPGCSSGIKQTRSTMFACGTIADNIDRMVDDAKKAGINLTGGGYRSTEEQTQLRIKNCNGDTTNPSAPCTPATGLPGQSNHNNGLAFDLRCDGVGIQTRDNKCYLWLQQNASRYGLQNLNTAYGNEPWHWSVDGR